MRNTPCKTHQVSAFQGWLSIQYTVNNYHNDKVTDYQLSSTTPTINIGWTVIWLYWIILKYFFETWRSSALPFNFTIYFLLTACQRSSQPGVWCPTKHQSPPVPTWQWADGEDQKLVKIVNIGWTSELMDQWAAHPSPTLPLNDRQFICYMDKNFPKSIVYLRVKGSIGSTLYKFKTYSGKLF